MLNKYGIKIKAYLKENKPIKYNDKIMDGTIVEYITKKQNELKSYALEIREQLHVLYPIPKTNEFLVSARYNYMIDALVEEYLNEYIKNNL